MASKKKKKQSPPPRSPDDIPLVAEVLAGSLTRWQLDQLQMIIEHLKSTPVGGRPRQHAVAPRELRERVFRLTRVWRFTDADGVLRVVEGELRKRYKARGLWPDTKTKWSADTAEYLQGWWDRANSGAPSVPYPAEEIAVRLGPNAPKHTGSLLEVALFVVGTRWGITRETLRGYL